MATDDPTRSPRLSTGKVPWDLVAGHVASVLPEQVILGPAAGEDAALVTIGGELWAVASDPISFTAVDAGRLAVQVNANDVAVRGARPRFFLAVVLVAPEEATEARIAVILDQIRSACDELGVALIGGHTEVTPGLPHSMVVGTMLGSVVSRPLTTGGLREGDRVGMTKWAGLEGTAILLAEYGEKIRAVHGAKALRNLDELLPARWLSVVDEALLAAAIPEVSALHDVTEGGVGEALHELGRASGLVVDFDPQGPPVLPESGLICADLGLNPLGLIGSGAMLVGCGEAGCERLEQAMASAAVPFAWLGRAVADRAAGLRLAPRFARDEILKAFLVDGLQAVVFDMDGTLVHSEYDWQEIRARLGVSGGSIIDELNDLPEPDRSNKWEMLDEVERQATRAASLKDGVCELLELLREYGLRTALVTNNSEANTAWLLSRFQLDFDLVLTRDSGLWKPSGAPLVEVMRQLACAPEHTLAVGDSAYDIRAARAAGCAAVCLLHDHEGRHAGDVDLAFADVPALSRYLRIVL